VLLEEHELHYAELFGIAEGLTNASFCNIGMYKRMDYNGAFAEDAQNENAVLINREDYVTMEDVVSK
jgi:hypothetical protein